jgi:hypothetical protein
MHRIERLKSGKGPTKGCRAINKLHYCLLQSSPPPHSLFCYAHISVIISSGSQQHTVTAKSWDLCRRDNFAKACTTNPAHRRVEYKVFCKFRSKLLAPPRLKSTSDQVVFPPLSRLGRLLQVMVLIKPQASLRSLQNTTTTLVERSEAGNVFPRSNTGIVGSNPTRGMDVCVSSVFVLLCV